MSRPDPIQDQRGVALVMAIIVLLVMSLLAITMMSTINVETKVAGLSMRTAQAEKIAEAGLGEAMERIRNGDIPNNNNPRTVGVIFNASAGSVPVVGADTTALATAQPAGSWLGYSTATKGPKMLTVSYKTDPAKTVIYMYDSAKNPAIQTVSGMPIYTITSTGVSGNASRTIIADVVQKPVVLNMKGAVVAGHDISKFTGNAFSCGYNHRADTPYDTGSNGRTGAGGCNENAAINHWEVGSGNLAGLWSTGTINSGGNSNREGVPPEATAQTGFYTGPWESVGMTQAQFYSWVGAPSNSFPSSPDGIFYLDNNSTTQDYSWSGSAGGASGSGFLYVDGDLTMNSGFAWRGLIYVEGDLKLNGHAWILGGLIVRGNTDIKINGGATVLYSADAIQQNIAKANGSFATLSWREQ